MKKELLEITKDLTQDKITESEARILLLDLLGVGDDFILVDEQKPPHNVELLAKSPTGTIHLCSWRPAYNIFTCQTKSEESWDWKWKLV